MPERDGDRLVLEDVSVRFGGIQALTNIRLRVGRGEIVGVIGPNGSGKTTLINCISGVSATDKGRIWFEHLAIEGTSAHERSRRGIRRTFQNVALFEGMSVLDNLRVGADHRRRTQRRRSAADVAESLIEELGLGPYKLSPVQSLSMGYRKRVEIGRALAGEPKVLLLDEPSAGIRPADASVIMKLIGRVCTERGMSVVLVEHDMPLLMSVSDRVLALDFGEEIATGRPEAVQANEAVQAAYLGGIA